MTYSLINPCSNCNKKDCKDAEKIQKAILEIHNSNDGTHLGSGSIVLSCCRQDSNYK